jgi:hypothetical protein
MTPRAEDRRVAVAHLDGVDVAPELVGDDLCP